MPIKRGKMSESQRREATWILAIIAILVALGILLSEQLWLLLVWFLYWIIGVPATKLGQWFIDVMFELEYDPDTEMSETLSYAQVMIYLGWIAVVPILGLGAFAVTMFRTALRYID